MAARTPDPLVPRAVERGMTITLVGPLIGALIMFALMFFIERMWHDAFFDFGFVWRGVLLYMGFGWPSGLLPALASAVIWLKIEPWIAGGMLRTLAAASIGALSSALLIWPFIWLVAGSYAPDYGFALPAAVAGAGALLATARPWRVPSREQG